MTDQEVKQQLLQLENRDVVKKWYKKIHNRELSTSRAKEINAAAKQSSEFFSERGECQLFGSSLTHLLWCVYIEPGACASIQITGR